MVTAEGGRADDPVFIPRLVERSNGSKTKQGKSGIFQPYLMASGQSKEVSGKVLGGDGTKRDVRRRKEKAAPLN